MAAKELPKLPYGEGSMSYMPDGKTIMYKKSVNKKRISVYGSSPRECIQKMRDREKEIAENNTLFNFGTILLCDAMDDWHNNFKKNRIKQRSWDREYHTKINQIYRYPIANMQMQAIDEHTIQKHINKLIKEGYSYSTVVKTYELLNQFFRWFYMENPNKNPMNRTEKPTKQSMDVQEKQIEYFDAEDFDDFIREACRKYSNDKPVYRYGNGLVAMVFTLLRIGEARALRWRDINFHTKTITVREAVSRIQDGHGGYKEVFTKPKYDSVRNIGMSEECCMYMKAFKETQAPASEDDWVFAAQNGNRVSERNLRRCLNNIQDAAEMKVRNSGFHVLRHTGISLFCRAGVDEIVVARYAGQRDLEMIHRVYRHVSETEKLEAVEKIDSVRNKNLMAKKGEQH